MTSKLSGAVWTPHALRQAAARGVGEAEVEAVLEAPEQVSDVRPGRVVAQRRVAREASTYLIRVFVDVDREPFEIVTAYRTSKIGKYEAAP